MKFAIRFFLIAPLLGLSGGCHATDAIEIDLSSEPVQFIVDHHGWPRPFRVPRVTDVALASEEDGDVWELQSESTDGVPAKKWTIVFGEVPEGFKQTFPAAKVSPKPLTPGRTYFLAAEGPTSRYKLAFALPVDYRGPLPTTLPTTSGPER